MTFRFIGKDGSLGFKQGACYDLQIHVPEGNSKVWIEYRRFQIPYGSFKAFFQNWEEL